MNISRIGAGTGTVTSSPAGIDCGGDCDQVYDKGTVVTLTAEADTGSTFAGWSGDCSSCGTNTSCDITMNANKTCTATFALSKADQTISWSNPADIVYGTALNGT